MLPPPFAMASATAAYPMEGLSAKAT